MLSLPLLMAQTVYKTVEDGVTQFSDAPPATGDAEVLTITTPAPASDGVYEQRLANMRDTTDRMAADRREREQRRDSSRGLAPVSSEPTVAAAPGIAPGGVIWSGNYWPVPRQRYNRGFTPLRRSSHAKYPNSASSPFSPLRPAPLTPVVPPPGWSVIKPGNAQLMRPIVSRRP
ncbi:MAG: DUF4124 domain-containing protein [Congregibacter sp.]